MSAALEALLHAIKEEGMNISSNTLFIGAEPAKAFLDCAAWQPLRPIADQCTAAGMKLINQPEGKYDDVIFLPGKSREEVLQGFVWAHDHLENGGRLWVAITNTAGASRYEKELRKVTPLACSISKHKCRAFCVVKSGNWDVHEWRETLAEKTIPETEFITTPGVFSAKKIDLGSELLISHLPASLHGQVADFGAGWGYLSYHALQKCRGIQQIDLFEADARSLDCARKNVHGNAQFIWHDITQGVEGMYDHILINPPFHTAQAQDVDLGLTFLSVAASALKKGGTMYLVANRHLPYEAHLQELNLRTRKITENHTFKVLFCS